MGIFLGDASTTQPLTGMTVWSVAAGPGLHPACPCPQPPDAEQASQLLEISRVSGLRRGVLSVVAVSPSPIRFGIGFMQY